MNYEIDATNKKLGRIATEVATLLRGKNSPSYKPNELSGNTVHIINAGKLDLSDKKLEQKEYKTFSGYPSGLKHEKRGHLIDRRGLSEVFRRTVRSMLPDNKLRDRMLKNLKVTE